MSSYFLDTYALIEIISGNVGYTKFLSSRLFTSVFNLFELYYNILKDYPEETAKKYFLQFKKIAIPIKDEHIFLASKFRLENKKKKFSYADSIGYSISRLNNIKFLTGDNQFKDIQNVEFVK